MCYFLLLKYAFWEPSGVERDSLIYELKIPKIAKDFPTWEPLQVPLYSFRFADGVKPRAVIMTYTSKLTFTNVFLRFKNENYNCAYSERHSANCFKSSKDYMTYDISLTKKNANTEVVVVIIGNANE